MRFSKILTFLTAASIVASHPTALAAPANDRESAFHALVNNPPDIIVTAKDVDPKASSPDDIVAKIWNVDPAGEAAIEQERKLAKRYSLNCYWGTYWILQSQLYDGKNKVCNKLQSNNQLSWGASAVVDVGDFFTVGNGHPRSVHWYLKSPSWGAWSWDSCYNTFFELIWNCHGDNPDSDGGQIWDYNGWDAEIWITDGH